MKEYLICHQEIIGKDTDDFYYQKTNLLIKFDGASLQQTGQERDRLSEKRPRRMGLMVLRFQKGMGFRKFLRAHFFKEERKS